MTDAVNETGPAQGWVLSRLARETEYFAAHPASGFMWTKKGGDALRFARERDAKSVAVLVADDCTPMPAADLPADAEPALLGYEAAVANVTGRPGGCISRPGLTGVVADFPGRGLTLVPHEVAEGTDPTAAFTSYVPSAEDLAATDWEVVQ